MIFQFGTSRFLQAHVDLFAWEASKAGQKVPAIAIVQVSNDPGRGERLHAFNNPSGFPVHIRGLKDGRIIDESTQVKSVKCGLSASRDWAALCSAFVHHATHIVSNSGDAGFEIPQEDHVRPSEGAPRSFCAILLSLLHLRWRAGQPGITLMPCELVASNGRTLQRHVSALAEAWALDALFRQWLATDCKWVNTLVDRIVSEPLEPAGAVAEPYALWAIEEQPELRLPFTHPSVVLTPDLEPFERLKLHILNLGHTWLAEQWQSAGADFQVTVLALMQDDGSRKGLEELYEGEVLPGFAARGMEWAAKAYIAEILQRFANPYLHHRMTDIHSAHPAKMRKRMGGFVRWVDDSGRNVPLPRLRAALGPYEGQK